MFQWYSYVTEDQLLMTKDNKKLSATACVQPVDYISLM